MSFDIAILSLEKRVSNAEASEIYAEIPEGNYSNVAKNAAIEDFYRELTAIHPEIDDIPDDKTEDIDFCPWSCEFDKSAAHIIISSVWSKSDYVYDLVQSLAVKHNLALFSPQAEIVVYPDGSEGGEVEKEGMVEILVNSHNKAFKWDSCRVAFWVCGDFCGENGLRKVGLGGTHPLTRR